MDFTFFQLSGLFSILSPDLLLHLHVNVLHGSFILFSSNNIHCKTIPKYASSLYLFQNLWTKIKQNQLILWSNSLFTIYTYTHMYRAMAPHSSTLAWKIPWTEETGRLQSMVWLRVGHDWGASLSLLCIEEGNGNPLQCSCLENARDGGAWCSAGCGVTQSWIRLKWL